MAVDRGSVERSDENRSEWPCPLERGDRRRAIIETARAIAAKDGFGAVTLSAVAEKMKFAPAVVYGFFSTRQELLELISVDDAPETEIVPENEASAVTVPADERSDTAHTEELPIERTSSASHPPEADADGEYGALLKAQAAELDKLAKRIILPGNAPAREGTDAALARLETRLHVIEQSYAELEKNQAKEIGDLKRLLASADENTRQVLRRMEETENRYQSAFAELHLSLFNLENPGAAEAKVFPPPPEGTPFAVVEPVRQAAPEAHPSRFPFISSARNAAIDAALAGEVAREPLFRLPRFSRQTQFAVMLALVVCGAGVGAWRLVPAGSSPPATIAVAAGTDRLAALAASGNADAELTLGVNLLRGDGRQLDLGKAVQLLTRAAEAGQPVAQNYLGVLYRTGTGVAADVPAAQRWFEAAALQGNRMAMANLGKLYAGGWQDGTDFKHAAKWFVRAAMLGDADSAFNLAVLYERGDGVPASLLDAYKWYAIAAAQGDDPAKKRREQIARILSAKDLASARLLAQAFKPLAVERAANEMPKI